MSSSAKKSNEEGKVETGAAAEQPVPAAIASETTDKSTTTNKSSTNDSTIVSNESPPEPTFRQRRQQNIERRRHRVDGGNGPSTNDDDEDNSSTGASHGDQRTIITTLSDVHSKFRGPQPGAYPVGGSETASAMTRRTEEQDDYENNDPVETTNPVSAWIYSPSVQDDVITATVTSRMVTSEDNVNTESKNQNQSPAITRNESLFASKRFRIALFFVVIVVIGGVTTISVILTRNSENSKNHGNDPANSSTHGAAVPPGSAAPSDSPSAMPKDIDYLNEFLSTPFENLDVAAETLTSISVGKHEL